MISSRLDVSTENERRRRMASVWHGDIPAVHEEVRARRVLAGRLAPRKQLWTRGSGLAITVAVIALVGAGAWAGERMLTRGSATALEVNVPTPSLTRSATAPQTPVASASVIEAMPSASGPAVKLVPSSRDIPVQTVPLSVTTPEPVASQSAPVVVQPAPSASLPGKSAWVRAADALQRGDPEAADKALAELASGDNASERDAASLARAQNWLTAGQRDRARPVLQRLAASGATPWIRARAAELLAKALGSAAH